MNQDDFKQLEQLLVTTYNLASIDHSEPISHGYLSDNWRVYLANGHSVFLKQYRKDITLGRVETIYQVITLFAEAGIPAIAPFSTHDGKQTVVFQERLYSLFPFIVGIHHKRPTLTAGNLQTLGRMLATIHTMGAQLPRPNQLHAFQGFKRQKFIDQAHHILQILTAKKDKTAFDEQVQAGLIFKLACVNEDQRDVSDFIFTDWGIIHGDFHEHNVFFDQQNNITAVFDWEKCQYGPRAFELIRSLNLICLSAESKSLEERFARAKILFDAYQAIYPVTQEEFETALEFYYVDQFYSIWIENLHYLQNITKADPLLDESLQRIHMLKRHRHDLIRTLKLI